VDPCNASSPSPASPSPDTRLRAISTRVTPRFLRSPAADFLAFPEPVALGWSRHGRLSLRRGWLRFSLVRVLKGRTFHGISRLRDYDAISVTAIRNERYKATILVGTTSAFGAIGELDAQGLRT
jgi:hypothetical protein